MNYKTLHSIAKEYLSKNYLQLQDNLYLDEVKIIKEVFILTPIETIEKEFINRDLCININNHQKAPYFLNIKSSYDMEIQKGTNEKYSLRLFKVPKYISISYGFNENNQIIPIYKTSELTQKYYNSDFMFVQKLH